MSYEFRVLSGLHRGAILPLDEETLSIGAHEDADVVLVDPGIQKLHARLSRSDSGWVVESNEGDVFSADGTPLKEASALARGSFVRIGPIWICISEEDDPWPEPPAEFSSPATSPEASAPMHAAAPAVQADGGAEAAQPRPPRKNVRRAAFMPALVLIATTAAAAYAFTSKPEPQPNAKEMAATMLNSDRHAAPALDPGAAGAKSQTMTQADLKKEFRKRLANAELINRFDLQLNDDSWDMRADLDEDEASRFERVLATFMREYVISFPVRAKIVPAEGMLPFKISQVMSGTNASIVTTDGRRMYIGDEMNGVRLVGINGKRLKFMGKRKIEIVW